MLIADWVKEVTGRDPATGWRETYSSPRGAAKIIQDRGGLVAHFDACLGLVDVYQTDCPAAGDVAVVDAALHGETGGILLSPNSVATLTYPEGIIIRHSIIAPIMAAWRIR
jgi:hypothetical protein